MHYNKSGVCIINAGDENHDCNRKKSLHSQVKHINSSLCGEPLSKVLMEQFTDKNVMSLKRVEPSPRVCDLNHWGRMTHIYVGKLTIIGSDNGLSPGRRQAITWINAGILFIRPLGTYFRDILIEIHIFSFKKIHFQMSSIKWRLCCLNVLQQADRVGYQQVCRRNMVY